MGPDTSVEDIAARYAQLLAEFRGDTPRVERIGMSVAFVRAVEDIGWLLDHIADLEQYAHQQDLGHLGQRNELELLRADNLQHRSEDVYYGRNRPGYDPRHDS